jgi:hypothetical protein
LNQLDEVNFKSNDKNPLTELSELRLEVEQDQQDFAVKCLLRFGKMLFEYKDREYEIGLSRAHLRLALEGCKTAMGSAYGENVLEHVEEEAELEIQTSIGFDAAGGADADVGAIATTNAHAHASRSQNQKRSQVKRHLPVMARPNDSWEVKAQSVAEKSEKTIEGTAIPSQRLCVLQRKQGGNRISVVGEVHVSKTAVKVSATGGNFVGKSFSELLNKDAIVSLILKRAVQREASTYLGDRTASTVAVSQCEVWEE